MSAIPYNEPAFPCGRCQDPSIRKQGHQWLCAKHYRFGQMKACAKRHGKAVPTHEQLDNLLSYANGLICKDCDREMNWLSVDGPSTVVSLQHYRSGSMALVCRACNTRHARMEADTFCDLPRGEKRCPGCGDIKPLAEFGRDNSGRWDNRRTYCRRCANERHKEWVGRNRDNVNRQQRERRAAR